MAEEINYLVCFRVMGYIGSNQDVCSLCREPVWRAYFNPEIDFMVICADCMLKMDQSQIEVMPPTQKQLDDMKAYEQQKRGDIDA